MRPVKPKRKTVAARSAPREAGPESRARTMLDRLETDGPNPVQAAEELDRLQASLDRAGKLPAVHAAVAELCDAWTSTTLRGDRARAWLVLVGSFGLAEHIGRVGELARDSGLSASLRVPACRVLGRFKQDDAVSALQEVVLSRADAQVRTAAAEGLGEIGDRSARPVLEALLDEDLSRGLWSAVSAAVDRLR